ncbi:uncharacterized protein F5891DRAFT_1012571 [Suillus fuscotomentosus]|uniref:DUF6533 domain-containing protein n=1 Tax=Suillus fuscotomentosus TaxID=1912939 RepID=A0AAD4EEF9_9AGAM|nr:uncharacterized protein F5891DRAFT_1012571 [Suillus fuscotomentosus]KAG1904735.1 hypothetical protein F5891DRAFT_1012571 [Suillus fuscotomentosus]
MLNMENAIPVWDRLPSTLQWRRTRTYILLLAYYSPVIVLHPTFPIFFLSLLSSTILIFFIFNLLQRAMGELETAQHFIYITQVYFCYAVIVWDWAVSLPREWTFIWKTHWTPVKTAYLFCRYWVIAVVPYLLYAFVTNHTEAECQRIYKIPVALAMWNQVGSESVLLIRTYAFFNRNNYLLAALVCALAGVVGYQLFVDTSEMMLLPFVTPPFIAPLLFDTIVTAITVWKAFAIRRRSGGPSSKLIQTFLREGVFYYILISIANLINGIFYLQPRQVMSALNIPLSVMMAPLLACRLILDLRERGAETVSHSEGTGPGRGRHRGPGSTIASNIMLSTIGSIQPDLEAAEVELDEMHFELGVGYSGDSTRSLGSVENATPAPAYNSIEMGFSARPGSATDESGAAGMSAVSGIRIDVEKTTSTI